VYIVRNYASGLLQGAEGLSAYTHDYTGATDGI
jgi:hypothetical protein